MIRAALLLAMAAAAVAMCPNSCSGHGRCSPGDVCECFRQADDTTPAYVGADCSQRVCPKGRAFDAISDLSDDVSFIAMDEQTQFDGTPQSTTSTARLVVDTHDFKLTRQARVNVRVLSVDTGASTVSVQFKLEEHDKYSQPITVQASSTTAFANLVELKDTNQLLPNFGTAAHDTGIKVYFTGTANVNPNNLYSFTVNYRGGVPAETANPNSVHQYVECSGRGSCDRSSGRCDCSPGFGGDSCQRASCPNDCSGHGVCQSLTRFVKDIEDNSFSYANAWDGAKVMGCLCDTGFRGADCSQIECPSGADPMGGFNGLGLDQDDNMGDARDCSGRGTCDYSSGLCECYPGHHGERCEFQTTFV